MERVLTVVSCSRQYEELPQTTLTLEPPFPEIFTGETVTLRCGVEGGSTGWKYLWYKDSEDTPGLQTAGCSITGDSYTITAAAVSDQGQYFCRGQRKSRPSFSQLSNPVTVTVSDQWVILQTPPQPVFEGDTLTLRCHVWGYTATRFVFYKDNKWLQSQADTELSVDRVSKNDEGSYRCTARWSSTYSGDSAEVRVSVREGRPKPALTREPAGKLFEGDTVTLSCVVEGGSGGWRYLWYKDRQGAPVYQTDSSSGTGARYTISAAALSHSGEYWCGAGRGRNTSYSQYSDPIWVNVTALFSRVTLTASPGATVKEGEALNLTCEAAVNKTPRPQLHYIIVRDGEPVTKSTDSALYSIASTEKSHTGSYTCAVESQGVKKSSQELHIELQNSWSWIIAALSVSLVLIVIAFTLLLFYRYKTKGFLFIAAKSRRPADQTPAQPSRGTELSGLGQEPGNSTTFNIESVYAEVKPNEQNKAVHVTDTPSTSSGDEILYSVIDLKNAKPAKPRPKHDCDVLYSAVLVKTPEVKEEGPQG
ncbi:Fc receptor-like protein 5 isoform X2 [Acipenser ruthenus]|uniref:Fc receptor-like protein 5 isoform X2 n=1 Tax=Acipenser ruthenus TaxID=7906 RepID=UPI002740C76E|nr:Fc receptor-like protein 5 isoform X2 [Acipenser ruthenus]